MQSTSSTSLDDKFNEIMDSLLVVCKAFARKDKNLHNEVLFIPFSRLKISTLDSNSAFH